MRSFDAAGNAVVAGLDDWELVVDVLLLPVEIAYNTGSLFQFLGDVETRPGCSTECRASDGRLILHARVARCVDGLDVDLFKQALLLRRQMLAAL